jgi:glycyl-tRNA synthetase beta chain
VKTSDDLLIELGTEELPPLAIPILEQAFATDLTERLRTLGFHPGTVHRYATPRRLAVWIEEVAHAQSEQTTTRRGPALTAAFDAQGQPTKAALGFAAACGVTVDALAQQQHGKSVFLVHQTHQPGQSLQHLLPDIITQTLHALPIPRRMRWGTTDAPFIRPIHWLMVRFGQSPITGTVLGHRITDCSYGHRHHAPAAIIIDHPRHYAHHLRTQGFVEADFCQRRDRIQHQVTALAQSIGGITPDDPALLDEVTALCEWPVALLGQFEARFLALPPEVLMATMRQNQKYFPITDAQGALLPYFVTIANIDSRQPELVRQGNERVIRPRFADAEFFYQHDTQQPLHSRQQALHQVIFQEQLGTLWERSQRLMKLARTLADSLGDDPEPAVRAAELAKCDLVTHMVGEFGQLQGVIGCYYAQHDHEPAAVCQAIREHYQPRHAGDAIPATPTGQILALADKLDLLIGIFAIGQRPTGLKDPYGLRRAAIGVLRILIEQPLVLDLRSLLTASAATFSQAVPAHSVVDEVLQYCLERLPGYYADQGIASDRIDAVLVTQATTPAEIDRRVRALDALQRRPEALVLAAAYKRIQNLLKKQPATVSIAKRPQRELLQEPAERALAERIEALEPRLLQLLAQKEYDQACCELAGCHEAVNAFFDQVMIMTEDTAVRLNRLALLAWLQRLMLAIGDFSRLQTPV